VAAFVGRARERDFIDDARHGDIGAVIAIDGMGGVGKTALAVHWAHRVADRFPDGQLYVNLQGYASAPPLSPMQVVAVLLRNLGVAADQVPVELEEAAGLYRSLLAGKRVFVILDNAYSAEQVRPLLPGSPDCMVVVTSRDRMTGLVATHGARQLTVDVLDDDEAVMLLTHVVGQERVASEPEAVAELAKACGYLPLALRIAAANLSSRPGKSIAGYLAELRTEDRLDGLTVPQDPHVAVGVAFDHSYHRLASDHQRLFRLLGLNPGPDVSVIGAAALADLEVEVAGQLLDELVDAHLVEPRGHCRYGQHDLLALYARQRAQQDDGRARSEAAMERLLDWYLHSTEAATSLLRPGGVRLPTAPSATVLSPTAFAGPSRAAAWLVAELTNLVAAARYAADHGPRPAAWRLADALREYFWQRRPMVEWQLIAEAALEAATVAGDVHAQVIGYLSLGQANRAASRLEPASRHLATALTLARQVGWTNGEAAALSCRGTVGVVSGDLRQAAADLARAAELFRQSGLLGGRADALFDLGLTKGRLGRLNEAVEHHNEALSLFRRVGDVIGEVAAFGVLGEVDQELGRLEGARELLTRAMRLYEEAGMRFGQAYFLRCLAAVDRDAGNLKEALAQAQEALSLCGEIGDRATEARVWITLASIHLQLGDAQDAGDHFRHALDLAQQISTPVYEAQARLGMADVCLALDQPQQALDRAHHALRQAATMGMRILEGQAHLTLATAHHRLGRPHQACKQAQHSLDLHRETGHRLGAARALRVLGRALRDVGDLSTATERWKEALALFSDIGSPEAAHVRALLAGCGPSH
jgi:tetratricopeptide (TPR) repeat protein